MKSFGCFNMYNPMNTCFGASQSASAFCANSAMIINIPAAVIVAAVVLFSIVRVSMIIHGIVSVLVPVVLLCLLYVLLIYTGGNRNCS